MPVFCSLQLRQRPHATLNGTEADVADLDELDVGSGFDDFARDLVTEHDALRRRRAAAHHVLIAAADVRRDDLEDDAVIEFAIADRELRKIDRLNFDFSGTGIDDAVIFSHAYSFSVLIDGFVRLGLLPETLAEHAAPLQAAAIEVHAQFLPMPFSGRFSSSNSSATRSSSSTCVCPRLIVCASHSG